METPPTGPAAHAEDFSRRYADDIEIAVGQVMLDLGLREEQMGARDPGRRLEHHTFFPQEGTGGSVNHAGQVTLDSGLFNPALLDANYDEATGRLWRRTPARDRAQAIIPHELAEHEHGGDHELALIAGPETPLPISHRARELLRQMERGWRGSGR